MMSRLLDRRDPVLWAVACILFSVVCLASGISQAGEKERAMGRNIHHQMWGDKITPKIAGLASITDRQIGLSFEELYGRICVDSVLDNKTRSICTISCLTAQGLFPEAKIHMLAALHSGWKPNEVRETLLQLTYVGGFPLAIEAIKVLNGLLDELGIPKTPLTLEEVWGMERPEAESGRQQEGDKKDKSGDYAIEIFAPGKGFEEMDWAEKGDEAGSLLYGEGNWKELKLEAENLSPGGSRTLAEAIFGQIISRPVVDIETRSMCLITTLLARRNIQALADAIEGALSRGCDHKKLRELIYQMTMYVGWPPCLSAISVIDSLMETKKTER